MRFSYEPLKAAQAAALLIKKLGPITRIKLMFGLYLADRQSLLETGSIVTGDKAMCLDIGLVLIATRRAIELGVYSSWRTYFSTPGQPDEPVTLKKEPGDEQLSEYEVHLLTEVAQYLGTVGDKDVIKLARSLPEWKSPEYTIEYEDILRAEGFSQEKIEAYRERAAIASSLDHIRIIPE